jgi:hypothetical protein
LEPGAPLPRRRLAAIRQLSKKGIPVSARIDPLIPLINEMEIEDLISAVCKAGACHIISSTYKAKPDNWKRLSNCFSEECEVLRPLYFDHGQIMSGSRYLPVELRAELLRRVNDVCLENAITFSTCREDLFKPTDISCDGSHLIKNTWNYSRAPNICFKKITIEHHNAIRTCAQKDLYGASSLIHYPMRQGDSVILILYMVGYKFINIFSNRASCYESLYIRRIGKVRCPFSISEKKFKLQLCGM